MENSYVLEIPFERKETINYHCAYSVVQMISNYMKECKEEENRTMIYAMQILSELIDDEYNDEKDSNDFFDKCFNELRNNNENSIALWYYQAFYAFPPDIRTTILGTLLSYNLSKNEKMLPYWIPIGNWSAATGFKK